MGEGLMFGRGNGCGVFCVGGGIPLWFVADLEVGVLRLMFGVSGESCLRLYVDMVLLLGCLGLVRLDVKPRQGDRVAVAGCGDWYLLSIPNLLALDGHV
jgi:hypothetical protein